MTPRIADRMSRVGGYLFAELEKKIQERRDAGIDVISLGIGDPDMPTPTSIVSALHDASLDSDTHKYPTNWGRKEFREAVASFYYERYGVTLDVGNEILPVLGGKEGIFHICMALLDEGGVALATDPGYPVYTSGPLLAGAETHYLPITPETNFKPRLDVIPSDVLERARVLFINYPNNPTGAVIEEGDTFFADVVAFAQENDIVVVHDNSYGEIGFDGYQTPSFLATPGAMDVGVEMFSLSKAWNMTGWRVGACVGNSEVVEALWKLKSNLDSGMFEAVQLAAVHALTDEKRFPETMSKLYSKRRDLVIGGLEAIGLSTNAPKGAIYVWVQVPDGHTSASFCELVLEQANVVISPGASFGPNGEGFVRISLSTPDDRLREAINRIESSMKVVQV